MSLPRLLLVEDDVMVRRFVALALEDQPIELVQAATLAQAAQALQGPPVALVLCDLMLPDGSGLDLLRQLALAPAPSPRPQLVAFSAGISTAVRRQLHAMGVLQVLRKPVPLADLVACAHQAQAGPGSAREVNRAQRAPLADVNQAVHHYFGGDAQGHAGFVQGCRSQFGLDRVSGNQALAEGDWATLRRLAHSLKSVMLTLGQAHDSALAASLETAAQRAQAAECQRLWAQLSGGMLAFVGAEGARNSR